MALLTVEDLDQVFEVSQIRGTKKSSLVWIRPVTRIS